MKNSYLALFVLCFSYIAVFSLASLTSIVWLALLFEVTAVLLPLCLSRRVTVCRACPVDADIGFSPRPCLTTLWLFPPFVGMVILLSLLTARLGGALGIDTSYQYGDNLWLCLFTSALVPAVTEEVFCRYIFLPRLSFYSKSGAVFASALFFAFLHGNLLQIPYALAAGIFLGALAVGCGSVLPGILFHLLNNTCSILLHFFADTALPRILLYALYAGLGISLLCAIFMQRRLSERLRLAFSCDSQTGQVVAGLFSSPLVIFLFLFVAEAILRIVR